MSNDKRSEAIQQSKLMSDIQPLPRDPRLTDRRVYTYWQKDSIRWSDTDMVGHVNNLAFAAYAETGRTQFFRDILARNTASERLLVLAQINISYLGEMHWPGDVDIGTCLLKVSNTSCRLANGLFYGDRCVGTVDSLLVHIDQTTRQASPMDDELRHFLERHLIKA